jgi:type VI secretion system protein
MFQNVKLQNERPIVPENLSLYDVLLGYFDSEVPAPDPDNDYFAGLSEEKKLRLSIIENLKLILQTRQGSVVHLPDFGLPDFLQLYIESGGSTEPIRRAIRDAILKYEPRIERATVTKTDFDEKNMRLSLKITAQLKDFSRREVLLTEFSTTGWTKVVFERDE